MQAFKALVASNAEKGPDLAWTELTDADLMDGDVTVAVSTRPSTTRTGWRSPARRPVVRRWPMIPGIDFAGTVTRLAATPSSSRATRWSSTAGGSARRITAASQMARVKGDWLIPLPAGLTAAEAMAIGTAGYTAMLCVMALERHGVTPGSGPVVVTGAAGGVGSVAIALLAKLGYERHRLDRPRGRGRLSQGARRQRRSSTARSCPGRPSRSARSAGPAASTRSAATRSPTCSA